MTVQEILRLMQRGMLKPEDQPAAALILGRHSVSLQIKLHELRGDAGVRKDNRGDEV